MPTEAASTWSRDEVLGGLPARRASTLLFAIEARTALLVSRSRRAMARFETERTVADREQLFLGAIADGRTLPSSPTIQDLNRYARQWADLVPDDVQVRAAVLKRVVDKYGLPEQAEAVRTALGAADPTVQTAFERQSGQALDGVEDRPLSRRERLSWWRAGVSRRLESLPPSGLAGWHPVLIRLWGVGVLWQGCRGTRRSGADGQGRDQSDRDRRMTAHVVGKPIPRTSIKE